MKNGLRRVAVSRIYINKKEFHNNHVVELFEHRVVNHYPLQEETAMTEWLGGTIILCDGEAFHVSEVLEPNELHTFFPTDPASSPTELGTDYRCGNCHIERL